VDNPGDEIRLVVPSRIASVAMVNAVAEEVAETAGLVGEDAHRFAIAVVEAATNAIRHGNRGDEGAPAEVVFMQDESRITVLVRDRSDCEFRPDPSHARTCGREKFAEHGRGLYILNECMDEVSFSFREGRGNECRLVWKLRVTDRGGSL
jgi:anti-sigma regulatory factor (Ser/Thr protein kinase)